MPGDVEYLYRREEEVTAKELFDGYNKGRYALPMLVVVGRGFYGNREETSFSTGQVIRFQDVRTQDRALMHDNQKNTLSVPLDYSHRFTTGHNSDALTLREVIEHYGHKLPVQVHFADPNVHIDSDNLKTSGRSFGKLEVVGVHHEIYFLANSIDTVSCKPLETVLPVPLYLKEVTFCPVWGVKRAREGNREPGVALQTLIETLGCHLTHVDFSQDYGDMEMVQLSQKPLKINEHIYQNIEQNVYINVRPSRRPEAQHQNVTSPGTSSAHPKDQSDYYEVPDQPPPRPDKSLKPGATRPAPRHHGSTGDASDGDHVYEPLDDLQSPEHETPIPKRTETRRHSAQVGAPGKRDPPSRHASVPEPPLRMSELQQALTKRQQHLAGVGTKNADTSAEAKEKLTTAKPNTAPKTGAATLPRNVQPAASSDKPPALTAKPVQVKPNPSLANKPASSAAVPPDAGASDKRHHPVPTDPKATYTNLQEMAIVKPNATRLSPPQREPATESPARIQRMPSQSKPDAERAAKLRQKTVNDIGEVLDELGLSKYRDKFRKERVDGVLLAMIDEQILREDFGLTRIEIIRLMTFIREGHKPMY